MLTAVRVIGGGGVGRIDLAVQDEGAGLCIYVWRIGIS